jgi:hypothetical protein
MIDSRNGFSPRFIHMPRSVVSKGATVAYVRDNSHVFFAWSQLSPSDHYEKSIGRNISRDRLETALPMMLAQAETNQSLVFGLSGVGFISVAQLISKDRCVSNVVADHLLATLTPMDFKHSYITSIVADLVFDKLI